MTVRDSIIQPPTAFGKSILNRTFSVESYNAFKSNKFEELKEYIQDKIQVFPKYLIKETDWYKWCLIKDEGIMYSAPSTLSTATTTTNNLLKTTKRKHRYEPYAQENISNYIELPDYRRHLRNFKKFKNKI